MDSDILCFPPMITHSACLQKLLERLELLHVCPGHPDKQTFEMVKGRNGQLLISSGEVGAYLRVWISDILQ